jgi:hypothetical protein
MSTINPRENLGPETQKSSTTHTGHTAFDNIGYMPLENLWDPTELICEIPERPGRHDYYGKTEDDFNYTPADGQVEGSVSRYWYPKYRNIHNGIRLKLEKILGCKLYNTYYFDRFYFPGQELKTHTDRDACEISVTLHISTNLTGNDAEWPICIQAADNQAVELSLGAGDAVLYKGCERPHWRTPMPKPSRRLRDRLLFKKELEYYYHQAFFHYVLANGERAHCADDRAR